LAVGNNIAGSVVDAADRSDETGAGQYADAHSLHHMTSDNDYAETETKPALMLSQYELKQYAQQQQQQQLSAADNELFSLTTAHDDNASAASHITYTQLQPL